jgi:hypothetical protein
MKVTVKCFLIQIKNHNIKTYCGVEVCLNAFVTYCDITPKSRNSSLLGTGSVNRFPQK